MDFVAPRIAPGVGVAMARVASRFYFFSILLVVATIYLPHKRTGGPYGLILLALSATGMMFLLALFPWDKYKPGLFTLSYLLSSSVLLSLLVYFTGGAQSSYNLLFFLVIFFSYFYNLAEMFAITTVVSLFYLLPYLYDAADPNHFAVSAITVLFFYLGTYFLYGVTRFVLRKNQVLEGLNAELMELYALTSGLAQDREEGLFLDCLCETLKDHMPSTYCIVMLQDNDSNFVPRVTCRVRTLRAEPSKGTVYTADRLATLRSALETRQPLVYRLEYDAVDDDMKKILTQSTCSALVVPIQIAEENMGAMIFGEERQWSRSPFTDEKIQLAVAIGNQVAAGLKLWWCYERLSRARRDLQLSHDKIVKAERLATLGEVTRAVEHEINNPLSVIVNWSEIYREDQTIDAGLRKKFQIIYDMSMRIITVIRKLSETKEPRSVECIKGQKMTDIGGTSG